MAGGDGLHQHECCPGWRRLRVGAAVLRRAQRASGPADVTAMISDSSAGAHGRMTSPERSAGGEVMRGREPEQKLIRDLLRRAQHGAGGVLLMDGEPGIGKSRLLRDATDEAADQGFSLAAGAADQLGQTIPLFALRAALREPFTAVIGADPGHGLLTAAPWWMTQIRAKLEQRAAAAPVLVCLDDLHWASPATLAALRTLPRDLKRHPVAWLLARSSVPQQATDYLFGQLEKDGAARLTVAPLDQDAVAAMLTDAFGAPPDQALADLARGAAGNPSLVAELIGGLRDVRAVQVTGGRAVLASARLPQRIHRLVQQRLDSLSQRTRHLLVTAAVLGPAFRLEDAAEMLGETPATLLPAVEEAMDAAIMTAAEHAFAFRHQLLRRAVDEMIPRPARKALHRQYGEILLARGESAARAASHLLQAAHPGDPASLAGLDQAAAQTLRSAPQTAADLALRALELTPPADPAASSRAVAAAEALTAAGLRPSGSAAGPAGHGRSGRPGPAGRPRSGPRRQPPPGAARPDRPEMSAPARVPPARPRSPALSATSAPLPGPVRPATQGHPDARPGAGGGRPGPLIRPGGAASGRTGGAAPGSPAAGSSRRPRGAAAGGGM